MKNKERITIDLGSFAELCKLGGHVSGADVAKILTALNEAIVERDALRGALELPCRVTDCEADCSCCEEKRAALSDGRE